MSFNYSKSSGIENLDPYAEVAVLKTRGMINGSYRRLSIPDITPENVPNKIIIIAGAAHPGSFGSVWAWCLYSFILKCHECQHAIQCLFVIFLVFKVCFIYVYFMLLLPAIL